MKLPTRSLRSIRLGAAAPRLIALALVAILALAGLRTILAGPPEAAPRQPVSAVSSSDDFAAASFAEGFARQYLSWSGADPEERAERLRPYFGAGAEAGSDGLVPAEGSAQQVDWTTVAGTSAAPHGTDVTVVAATSNGLLYLNVPVAHGAGGFGIAAMPALVGPPRLWEDAGEAVELATEVEDEALVGVAERALTNYLGGAGTNLLADLTPDAVVTLLPESYRVTGFERFSWVRAKRTIAVELEAQDLDGNTWALRYQLEVRLTDRWYVRSFQPKSLNGGEQR